MEKKDLEILLSVRPQYLAQILNGDKKKEVRKIFPDFKGVVHLYCTKGPKHLVYFKSINKYAAINDKTFKSSPKEDLNGKVVGKFICDDVQTIKLNDMPYMIQEQELIIKSKLSHDKLKEYANGKSLKVISISDVVTYAKPLEITDYPLPCRVDNCNNCSRYIGGGKRIYCNQLMQAPQNYCWVKGIRFGIYVEEK